MRRERSLRDDRRLLWARMRNTPDGAVFRGVTRMRYERCFDVVSCIRDARVCLDPNDHVESTEVAPEHSMMPLGVSELGIFGSEVLLEAVSIRFRRGSNFSSEHFSSKKECRTEYVEIEVKVLEGLVVKHVERLV